MDGNLVNVETESVTALANELENVFRMIGEKSPSLPEIVVVGEQSSGKSSVVESIIGKCFLPKGSGMVTRQPLKIRVFDTPEKEKWFVGDYAVFQHKNSVIFNDFNEIRTEIESIMNEKAGRNKEISEEPICLNIYTKRAISLTIIDLPGLTKIPVGNQPPDIEIRIRKMVSSYISNPNSVILAVVSANTDVTTSEALKLAREFDREGKRTLAVVTKLDLMDSGTDATNILTGRIVPVRLGIIGVVGRSQQDNLSGKTLSRAIKDERIFLRKNYPFIADVHGTPYLIQTLNKILKLRMRSLLPELKLRIESAKIRTLAKFEFLGSDIADCSKALLHIITSFCSVFCSALDGTSRQIDTAKLSGGARICYIFHETFAKVLDSIQPLCGWSNYDILTAIRNSSGARPALFVPEVCFELLIKSQIARLLEPSLACVHLIHDEMQQILLNSLNEARQEISRFPKLLDKMVMISSDIIRKRLMETKAVVENLINIESAYINTMHPEFRQSADIGLLFPSGKRKKDGEKFEEDKRSQLTCSKEDPPPPPPPCNMSRPQFLPASNTNILSLSWFSYLLPGNYTPKLSGTRESPGRDPSGRGSESPRPNLSERDRTECEAVRKLVANYFAIVRKSIKDKVPKTIMHFLVNFVRENIQRELVEALYKSGDETLMEESEEVKYDREEAKYILSTLQDVDSLLSRIGNGID